MRALYNEPCPEHLKEMVERLYKLNLAKGASHPLACVSDSLRDRLIEQTTQLLRGSGHVPDPQSWRHLYDEAMEACLKAIEQTCLKKFLGSRHYQYVLNLKAKESTNPTMDYFQVQRTLGKGGFGQVLEAVKRDCGHSYAMKVMQKKELEEVFGEDWEALALTERTLLSGLHHPLLVNLAYAFQTIDQLILVMDACPNGKLACEPKLA